jgi:outer membrane scaffolding protein for murein synthesis (MipA/OmpV family)
MLASMTRPASPQLSDPGLCAVLLLALSGLCGSTAAQTPGDEETEAGSRARYLLGLNVSLGPEYPGADKQRLKARPLWAYQKGRFRISTGAAGGLLDLGGAASGPGASAELLRSDRLRLGVALRIDQGRDSADSDRLRGVPDVRATLRGRVYASYALSGGWSLGAAVSQDLLGRQGGISLGLDLGYSARLGPLTTWQAGAGLSLGDRRYMRSYFGISERVAASSGYAVFDPGNPLRDVHAGLGFRHGLSRHWLSFGGIVYSRLLADAAASPLTRARGSSAVSLGLAYRW